MAVHDQAALGCDLYRAVAEHFDRITGIAGQVLEYCDDRSAAWLLNA
jgi:hypothetical protein